MGVILQKKDGGKHRKDTGEQNGGQRGDEPAQPAQQLSRKGGNGILQHRFQRTGPAGGATPLQQAAPLFLQVFQQGKQRFLKEAGELRQQSAALPHQQPAYAPQQQPQRGKRYDRHNHGAGTVPPPQPPAQPGGRRVQGGGQQRPYYQRQKAGQRIPQPQIAKPQQHAPKGHILQKAAFSR